MIVFSLGAAIVTLTLAITLHTTVPSFVDCAMDVELLPVTQKLAKDPTAMKALTQFLDSNLYLENYVIHSVAAAGQAAFLIYMGFSRSTLLLVVWSAVCLLSGAVVAGSMKVFLRAVVTSLFCTMCVALSITVSRHRRLQFLILRQFASNLETAVGASRKADSILNHTLKNTMADAAGEIELFLKDHPEDTTSLLYLRRSMECLRRGMRTCRHRQAYLQLAADRYKLSLQPVNLRSLLTEHCSGRNMQLSIADLTVRLDVTLCGLIMDNAISNAFKHGHPRNPDVQLRTEVLVDSATPGQRVRVAIIIRNKCHPSRPKVTNTFVAGVLSGDGPAGPSRSAMSDRIGLQQTFAAARMHAMEVLLVQLGDIVKFTAEMDVEVACLAEPVQHTVTDTDHFPPNLHICCIDDSLAMRRLLAASLPPHAGTNNVHVFGEDPGEVKDFIAQTLSQGDIAVLDQHLEYGRETNILGTDLVKELLEKGFKGLICIRSGNNADEDRALYKAAGAHCSFGKEEPLSQAVQAMKQAYLRHVAGADSRMPPPQVLSPSRARSSGSSGPGFSSPVAQVPDTLNAPQMFEQIAHPSALLPEAGSEGPDGIYSSNTWYWCSPRNSVPAASSSMPLHAIVPSPVGVSLAKLSSGDLTALECDSYTLQ